MKKRAITLLLALVMCLGLAIPALAEANPTAAQKFVNTAMSVRGKGASYFGFSVEWCGYFVSWCAKQNGLSDIINPNGWNGVEHYNYVINHGGTGVRFYDNRADMKQGTYVSDRNNYTPQTGDIVIFTWWWKNGKRSGPYGQNISHVGIVSSVSNGRINVVHGNWSKGDGGGQMVVGPGDRCTTSWPITSSEIYAYARPNWSKLTQDIISNGTYTLAPACAPNARLDVAGGSKESGANVQIYTDNGSDAQKWEINLLENGCYTLKSKASGKVLDTYYDCPSSGQNVMQCTSLGFSSEEWKIKDAGNGYYYLTPRWNEALCLDVSEGSSKNGTNVQVYDANQSNAQKWKLTRVDQPAAQTPAQPSKPTNLALSTNKSSYTLGETATITPSANNVTHYAMSIWLGAVGTGTRVYAQNTIYGAVTFKPTQAGTYTIRVDAKNNAGYISTEKTFTVAVSSQPAQHQHQKGTYLWFTASHPHKNYYTCATCGEKFTDNTTSYYEKCSTCNPPKTGHWGDWSDWSKTPVTATSTRQVETRQVKVSDAYREYRYVGYYCYDSRGKLHDCWCATYLKKLYGSATLRYSDWSTTRYSPNGKAWTCGSCNGNHIGVAEYSNGKPYWAEYILPGGNSYYWEESRTVEAKYETQYRYRDWIPG